MMRKIIIPTDFSENALNALTFAVELFKYEKCEIFLLHSYAEDIHSKEREYEEGEMSSLKEKTKKRAIDDLEQLEEKLKDLSPNPRHRVKSIAAYGLLVDEVNELVDKENADIVIMGTMGKSQNRRLTYGSNTLQVIKYVQCPVLSIPGDYIYREVKNILFPTNFLIPYQKRELKLVAEAAKAFNSKIHFLYLSNFPLEGLRQKENREFLREQFSNLSLHFHRIDEKDRAEGILEEVDHLEADLLVMVNSRYTYLENILSETTIDRIGLNPKVPFLVLQNYNRAAST